MNKFNIEKIRKDFTYLNDHYIYFDSAATTQKPKQILEKEIEYYTKYNGNPHSENMHHYSYLSTKILEEGRSDVAEFIGVEKEEIIFTKSASESLNIAILGLKNIVKEGNILLTILEHHANFVPYQVLAEENNLNINIAYTNDDGSFNYEDFEKKLNKDTKIIGLTLCSNVTGEDIDIYKIKEIINKKIKEYKSEDENYKIPYIILDLSQSINHTKININEIINAKNENEEQLEIYAAGFSGHKMYATQGIGVLYLNKKYQREIKPLIFGGGMINFVFEDRYTLKEGPEKFEAGSPNVAGVYSLTNAIKYINSIGIENINKYIKDLTNYARCELEKIEEVEIYSPKNSNSIISFNVKGIHSHDISSILNEDKIAIRAGHHCAMPLHKKMHANSSMRISFGIYNSKEEVDLFIKSIKRAIEFFK